MTSKIILAAALISFASLTGTAFAQSEGMNDAKRVDQVKTASIGTQTDAGAEMAQLRQPTSRDNRYIGDDGR